MRGIKFIMLVLGICFLYTACVPPKPQVQVEPDLTIKPDFYDTKVQLIYTWRDKRFIDSLATYLIHPNEDYRYLAAKAYGSIRDKAALPYLTPLLKDSSKAVRRVAAFSIGQLGDVRGEKALTDAFINQDTVTGFQVLNATILEALGKCGSAATLKLISETSTYAADDTTLLMGQMHALFQFGLRNIFHKSATDRAVFLLTAPNVPLDVKLVCGQYLHRFDIIGIEAHTNTLYDYYSNQRNLSPNLEMTFVPILLKSGHPKSSTIAMEVVTNSKKDYRIKVNTLNALKYLPIENALHTAHRALIDKDPAVSQSAAQFYLNHGEANQGMTYFSLIDSIPEHNWEARIIMAGATARHLSPYRRSEHNRLSTYLIKQLNNYDEPGKKRLVVEMMGNCFNCLVPLKNMIEDDRLPLYLRSAAIESFGHIATLRNFDVYYGYASTDVKIFIGKYLTIALLTPSDSLVSAACYSLIDPKAGLRLYIPDTINYSRLLDSLDEVSQSEDYLQLLKLQAFVNNKSTEIQWSPMYNKPVDWAMLEQLPDTIYIDIDTDYGKIEIALFTTIAPATVLSLYELIKSEWYNGRTFHRMVPNFVIQGGCTRGDGYGSLSYTISSETGFERFDDSGIVGIASAGPHTESQQFFITHSPTPHLNGNYTICGQVTEGMDAVHRIRRGDTIKSISVLPLPVNM